MCVVLLLVLMVLVMSGVDGVGECSDVDGVVCDVDSVAMCVMLMVLAMSGVGEAKQVCV